MLSAARARGGPSPSRRTPSAFSRRACSTATAGANVPSARMTRHQGTFSIVFNSRPTPRAAPGRPA
ncbi:hypothetical protein [Archangium violaceum]|uniref:hypothetical protein n=1 Tax=Archangium violaceum TaxID=83451 RepID=UPI001EEF94F4|nr:hypothetical protein [Archangium violaceum]